MNPKMTLSDAALCLGRSQAWVYTQLLERGLSITNLENQHYFDHAVATKFFQFDYVPKVVVFQILKGGTGKTSLAFESAVRASLYGAKVLCVDLDQQGNLTQAFNQTAEDVPVMVDHLAEGYPIEDSLLSVLPGISLLPSRIENALLDEVILGKNLPLDKVYRNLLAAFKKHYDLIIVDCPPSLGQSVAASSLAADILIAPVTPEKFALSGFEASVRSVDELELAYSTKIPFYGLLNKYEPDNKRSIEAWRSLISHPNYKDKLLPSRVRLAQAFPIASSQVTTIFENIEQNSAKVDVDALTQILLGIKTIQKVAMTARLNPVLESLLV